VDTLKIRLLGGFELQRGNAILIAPPTPKSRSLLAFLVLNRDRLAPRETVCALLWPDESEAAARKALRTALWRIRCAIEPGEDDSDRFVYGDAHQIGFRESERVWVDAWAFEDAIAAADAKPDEALDLADGEAMAQAAALYRGDYAAGVYDDWLAAEQARLRLAHLALIERIVAFHRRRERWLQAIAWAERALSRDPLREHLHRAVMACHMSIGDRPSALRQYARCEAALKAELGIAPMAETRALRDTIRTEAPFHPPDAAAEPPLRRHAAGPGAPRERLGSEVDAALSALRKVAQRLDEARAEARSAGRARSR